MLNILATSEIKRGGENILLKLKKILCFYEVAKSIVKLYYCVLRKVELASVEIRYLAKQILRQY